MHNHTQQPDVSVGIVVYNTPVVVLTATLQSLQQSTLPIRIIILCNSPDHAYQRQIGELCALYEAMPLMYRPNQGFGAGHNAIAEIVYTEWYVCCNPDIQVQPDTIARLITRAQTLPASMLLSPKILSPDGSIQRLARKHLTIGNWLARQLWRVFPSIYRPFEHTFDYNYTQPLDFPSGAFFLVRTDLFKRLGGFDTRFFLYCEDADLARRASRFGINYHVADTSVIHEWSQAWQKSPRAFLRQIRSLVTYFNLHGWI